MSRVGIGGIIAFCSIAAPASVQGAAWTLPAGSAQAIITATASRADRSFDQSGKLAATPQYRKLDANVWLEYGASDRLTLVLEPGLQHVDIETSSDTLSGTPQYVEAGARYRVARGDAWVASVQATTRWASRSAAKSITIDDTRTEADIRVLLGYGFALFGRASFVDVQAAERFRSGGSPDEIHADVTFGAKLTPKWQLLAQAFNVMSQGEGRSSFQRYDYFKVQSGVLYQLTRHVAIEGGGFATYAGRNAIQENGVLVAAWYTF